MPSPIDEKARLDILVDRLAADAADRVVLRDPDHALDGARLAAAVERARQALLAWGVRGAIACWW